MGRIIYHFHPEFKSPVMLASWPGMGAVASQAVDYIRRKLKIELFAEIETVDHVIPNSVVVQKGIAFFPRVPKIFLFYSRDPEIIICEAEDQFTGAAALDIIDNLLYISEMAHVTAIYTGAAFVQHISHRDNVNVYVVANSEKLLIHLTDYSELKPLPQGQISGLNGAVLGFAARKNIEAACFLASIPIYGINFPNPKASKSIVEIWQKLIGFSLDITEYDFLIGEADKALDVIEEQLRKISDMPENITSLKEKKPPDVDYKKEPDTVPPYVIQEIEELFEKAKEDKSLAHRLKGELDRWNLFKDYEDRFLDLFRESY